MSKDQIDNIIQNNKKDKESRKKRFLRRAAMVVSGAIVLSVAATEMMMLVLFGRKEDASTAQFPLRDWAYREDLEWHEVQYPSGENMLKGYLITNHNPRALMIIAHGMNASSDGFEPVVQYFAKKGYAVWIFDGTASGRSEGEQVVGLQQQRFDIRATVDYIRGQKLFRNIPLVLLGHSAGAYGAATEAQRAEADAVICVSGFCAPLTTMRHWARNYTSILADVQYPFLYANQHADLGEETNESAAEALAALSVPAMVVQGANDETVEDEISLYYKSIDRGSPNVTYYLEKDPNHDGHETILFNETQANEALLERIDRFIVTCIS